MTNQHPITPPPELVKQWWKDAQQADHSDGLPCWLNYVATQAARWGADQELEGCCEWANATGWEGAGDSLRAARRPITIDQDLAAACREWIKGCTCADRSTPQDCKECTDLFLQAVLYRSRRHGLKIGENSLEQLND